MLPDFISITDLQRNLKRVFASKKKPFHMVLSNNNLTGIVINKETAELLLQSGVLDQLREELWELHDSETRAMVRDAKSGILSKDSIDFDEFSKKYGV